MPGSQEGEPAGTRLKRCDCFISHFIENTESSKASLLLLHSDHSYRGISSLQPFRGWVISGGELR